jgi:hypothetical protein
MPSESLFTSQLVASHHHQSEDQVVIVIESNKTILTNGLYAHASKGLEQSFVLLKKETQKL